MNWPLIISTINMISAPINVILIGINLYLTNKAKTSSYREALYSKQIGIYSELAKALNGLYGK